MSTKERVLAALTKAENALSGEALAQELGVSRNAIWKAIEGLRADGYEIDAGTNRGYRLIKGADVITEAEIRRHLTGGLGCAMELHAEIDSTNTRAKALAAQGAEHGTLVCASSQTGGRGRFGRKFHSPDGGGIYMSLILRPRIPAEQAVMITSMTAVAVARAIERLADVKVGIKWVNDLFIAGRKVCGILCEAGMDFESGQLEYAVVGIGVNTARAEFPEEIRDIATSIGNVCGHDISRSRLIAEICNCMDGLYPALGTNAFMEESRARSVVLGKRIAVLRGDSRFAATARDIDDQGGLVIETECGTEVVRSGEISIRLEDLN